VLRHGNGLLLCLLADEEKDLAEPLDELDTELRILTHPDIKQVARIKALADFLYEKLSASDKVTRIETRRSVNLRNSDL
jgi:hypothetical protein